MKSTFNTDLEGGLAGVFNVAGSEVYSDWNMLPAVAGDDGNPPADVSPVDLSIPPISSPSATSQAGQQGFDNDGIAAPIPEANVVDRMPDTVSGTIAPEAGGGLATASSVPDIAAPDPAPAVWVTPAAGAPAAAATGFGAAFEALAQAGYQTLNAETIAVAPGAGTDAAPIAVSLEHAASVTAPLSMVELANPASGSIDPVANSAIGSGGATAAQVQKALDESGLSVNGSGIKVGVISDSFNNLGGAAADEADGALPPASDIDVIKDDPSGQGTDEGRAMMQIIHDIAPDASLAFYTADVSEQDFANGILALAAAGCKVICDDVSYYDEPFFQNGVVAQAIQTVEAEGVTYVTAAGNNGSNAYQAAWTPTSVSALGVNLLDAENFGGGAFETIKVTASSSEPMPLLLEWNQPYGDATADLELDVFRNGVLVASATNQSVGEPNNPWTYVELTSSGTYQIAIDNISTTAGTDPTLIKLIAAGDGLPATLSGADVGTVFGHAMTPGAITAGAVSTAATPAFGDTTPVSESFSSSGSGTELLFANNGTALSSPDDLSPVAVSGVDDIATTISGNLSDFYGTSAASASLAGVAALLLSANPDLSPAQVEQIMEQTATSMANSAVSGSGLVNVDAAVATADALESAALTVSNFNGGDTSDVLFWNPSTGDLGYYEMINGVKQGWHDIGGSSTAYGVVGVGDFNESGASDILFRDNATGDLGYYVISSNGTLAGWDDIGASSTAYSVVGIGDFYGNGTSDILFRDNATGDTGFYALNASGSLIGWQDVGSSSTAYSVVGVGDFYGNGTSDILFRDNATGDVGFYAMSNGVLTGWHDIGASSTAYSVVAIGDFNGQGTSDILFRNNSSGDMGYYSMSDGALTGWHDLGATSTAYSVVGVGDYFGNGVDDILMRDNATGDTGFYALVNGANAGWHDIGASSTAYIIPDNGSDNGVAGGQSGSSAAAVADAGSSNSAASGTSEAQVQGGGHPDQILPASGPAIASNNSAATATVAVNSGNQNFSFSNVAGSNPNPPDTADAAHGFGGSWGGGAQSNGLFAGHWDNGASPDHSGHPDAMPLNEPANDPHASWMAAHGFHLLA
jgi:Subtilase family